MDLSAFAQDFGDIFVKLGENVLLALPGIILAILILIVGYLVALLIKVLVRKFLVKIKTDEKVIKRTNLKNLIGDFKLSNFVALVIKWYVFILFFPIAADVVGLAGTSNLLLGIAAWVPNLIAAIFVAILGILIANYSKQKIEAMKFHNANIVSGVSYVLVLVLTFLIAFEQIGINLSLVSNSFLIILAGIMLAVAIGFGLGMKPEAEKLLKSWKKKL